MIDLTKQEIADAWKIFETSDIRKIEIRGQEIKRQDFWAQYYKVGKIDEKGALNLALGTIESVFSSHRAKNSKVERHIDRAFLDSKFVDATIDCSDGLEKSKMLKEFDKIN